MFGNAIGGFVGAIGDIGGAFLQNEFNKGRMKDQYQYNRELMERAMKYRYQWQMRDMKAAGLNPMLAFSQSPGTSSASVGLPSSSAPTPGSSAVAGYRASEQAKQMRQAVKESKARTRMIDNQAQQEWFKIATAAEEVHTARAKRLQEESVARAYEKFGPSGLARILELFPSLGRTVWDQLPAQKWGPRRSIYPSEGRGRDVRPAPAPSRKRDRNPVEPWKRRTR